MFKSWSIKAQLQFLVISTILFVVVSIALANFAHKFVESSQDSFNQKLIPLSNYSRDLNHAFAGLIHHYEQTSRASNLSQLENYRERSDVEDTFEHIWEELNSLVESDSEEKVLIEALKGDYQDFLSHENDLFDFKQQYVQAKAASIEKKHVLDRQLAQLELVVEKAAAAYDISSNTYLASLLTSLKHDAVHLNVLAYQLSDIQNDDALTTFEREQIRKFTRKSKNEITELPHQLQDSINKPLINDVQKAHSRFLNSLIGSEGLLALQKKIIFSQSLLRQTENNMSAVITMMLNKQGELTAIVNSQIYQTAAESALIVDKMRWKIMALGLLLTVVMLTFSFVLIRSINQSLQVVRNGIHALTKGRFETRLPTQATHAELDLLVEDFNKFANNTEIIIENYSLARDTLIEQEQYLRTVLNAVPEAILTLSIEGKVLSANPAAEKVLDASQEQLSGEDLRRFFADQSMNWTIQDIADKAKSGYEFSGLTYAAEPIIIQVSFSKISHADELIWVCVISDVTKLKETDQQLEQTSLELNAIFENAMVGIALIRDRKLIRVNQKFEELFLYSSEEIEGESTRCLYLNESAYEQFGSLAYAALSQSLNYEAHMEMRKRDGSLFWCALSGKNIDYDGNNSGSIWLFEDVTQQRENEERLVKLASVDTLTGLSNRAVFHDRLAHAIHKAKRHSEQLAVFFMDLDNFKTINDSLGHRIGDLLLIEVAQRVKSTLREGDTVARLGGDEFTVILEDVKSTRYVGSVADKVLEAMSQPYVVEGTEVNVSPSIGISLYPADGRDLDTLLRNADAAMYHAKNSGRNNFQFYSADMNAKATERLLMETALRKAVEKKEFFLHYQPQINIKTGQVEGAEALLRWDSEKWGTVSPAVFVPILEDTGLISRVGEFVIERACETYIENSERLSPDFKMAVNLSSRQFKGGNLSSRVSHILHRTGMPPKNLELEITESLLMDDTELAIETLSELSQLGINLAVDDFGTGYSSLSYLKRFPLNVLKIDGSFVRDITTDADDAAIVDAIMALANSLNLHVVAEGVETQEQLNYLSDRDCDLAQGYFFSKPLVQSDFEAFVGRTIPPTGT